MEVEKLSDDETNNHKDIIGPPRLTIYEIARIIGTRAAQIAYGAPILIPIKRSKDKKISELEIAKMELKAGILPLTVQRWLPDGRYQNIPINKLRVDENI